jgi:hypothetical protein
MRICAGAGPAVGEVLQHPAAVHRDGKADLTLGTDTCSSASIGK